MSVTISSPAAPSRSNACAQTACRPLYLVGVRAPLEVLEERERRRDDRAAGMTRAQSAHPAFARDYDLVIDASACGAEEGAAAIRSLIQRHARVSGS
ncbi:MAG: phosphotransferase-like protein [Ramlibacter sp.]